jgi:hypothetical protein
VELGAIGLQLRFIGHGTDQRMVEDVFGVLAKGGLIDELAARQGVQDGIDAQRLK